MLRSKMDFLYPHAAFLLRSGIPATIGPQLFCSASQSESRLLPQGLKRAAFHACDAQVTRWPFQQPVGLQGGCWNRGNAAGSPHGTRAKSSSPHLMLWYVLGTGKQHTLQSARQEFFTAHQQAVEVHLDSFAFLAHYLHTAGRVTALASDHSVHPQKHGGEGTRGDKTNVTLRDRDGPSQFHPASHKLLALLLGKTEGKSHIRIRIQGKSVPCGFCLRYSIA